MRGSAPSTSWEHIGSCTEDRCVLLFLRLPIEGSFIEDDLGVGSNSAFCYSSTYPSLCILHFLCLPIEYSFLETGAVDWVVCCCFCLLGMSGNCRILMEDYLCGRWGRLWCWLICVFSWGLHGCAAASCALVP